MPLVPLSLLATKNTTVHDGNCFAKEILLQNPRTPESNKALIEAHHLNNIVQPSFVRSHSVTHPSFHQILSDSVPISNTNWVTNRPIIYRSNHSMVFGTDRENNAPYVS